jgi:mannitol/fructose-specific phosphotransferase system IIA component (Ntr-type)
MNLASILKENQIVPEMQATEHWSAIVELVVHLSERDLLQGESEEAVLAALKEREEKTSTGIGHGVAIPHAFSDKIESVIAVFGRSHEGIDFDSIDNAPVRFIVLFIVPRDQYNLHLRTLASIAKLLNNGEVRAQLAEARDATEIIDVLARRAPRA